MGWPSFSVYMVGTEQNAEHSVFAIQLTGHLSPKMKLSVLVLCLQ